MMANRRAFCAALTLVIAMTASCTAILGIDKDWREADGGACQIDRDCDGNPCTPCEGGRCVPLPDMTDAPAQTPGDCHKTVCFGGKGEVVIDTTDPNDDLNDCTIDTCDAAGKPGHTAVTKGTACKVAVLDGTCDGFGKCEVICGPGLPLCDDTKPCTTDSCNAGTGICDFIDLADGVPTPGVAPVAGDCHVHLCITGLDTDTVDDTDLPMTTNDCVTPTCNMGAPSTPPKSTGTGCSTNGGKVCDAGTCYPCNVDTECPGPVDDCKHPQCTNHACGTFFDPVTKQVSQQTPGDCQVIVCDAAGGTKSTLDNNDPKVDGNPCTDDICTNGQPFNPPTAAGTSCGGSVVCNGAGQCVGCVSNANCTPPQTCNPSPCGSPMTCGCCPTNCQQLGATCGIKPDACGGMIQCNNNTKDGTETDVDCGGGGNCLNKCGQGKKCGVNSDCTSGFCVEGVCCNTSCNGTCQSCLAANKVSGSDGTCGNIKNGFDPKNNCADQGQATCGNDGSCDGTGACRYYATGSVCVPPSCATTTTLDQADTCTAAHTCMANGTVSCGNYICQGTACRTTCVSNSDCANGTFYCAAPNCLSKKADGQACGGAGECTSGNCIDGYCCNSSCANTCQACNIAGMQGTCSNIPLNGTDSTCNGANACNGAGACLLANGQSCANSNQCVSNKCTGGMCVP